jgi:hypothetical protein
MAQAIGIVVIGIVALYAYTWWQTASLRPP